MEKKRGWFSVQARPRILLFYIAILAKLIASALSAIGFVYQNGILMISGTVVWLVFFALLLMIAVPAVDQHLRKYLHCLKNTAKTIVISLVVLGVALVVFIVFIGLESFFSDKPDDRLSQLLVSLENVYGYNDATALSHQAAQNLIDGKNPYAEANTIIAMIDYNGEIDKITPLREGRFADVFPYLTTDQLGQFWEDVRQTPEQIPVEIESKFNYPAGGFLLPAPFVLVGISDFRFIYIILLLPALAYVIYKVRSDLRIHLIFALVASLELWNSLAAGETGFLYFPFLLLGWILPKRNLWVSALFMAIAITIKQLAWFVLPFYLILIFRTIGLKQMAVSLSIIIGVFLAANLAFIAMDPDLWFNSVVAPVTDNMFPLGVGIISIVTGGFIDIQSPLPFAIMELAIAALAVIWYFFKCNRYPQTGLILAVLPLFFAWRSLWGYFFYIDIIVLTAIMLNEYGMESNEESGKVLAVSSGKL